MYTEIRQNYRWMIWLLNSMRPWEKKKIFRCRRAVLRIQTRFMRTCFHLPSMILELKSCRICLFLIQRRFWPCRMIRYWLTIGIIFQMADRCRAERGICDAAWIYASKAGIFWKISSGCHRAAAERSFVSVATVRKHNTSINRKLEVSNREELMVYVDLFRRCGRLEELKNG